MDPFLSLQTTPLAAGQSLHMAVAAGTVLVAVQGELRVEEAPRWLADTLVPVAGRLPEGGAYRVGQAGWICVTAQGPARMTRLVPVRGLARLLAWWRRGAWSRSPVSPAAGG